MANQVASKNPFALLNDEEDVVAQETPAPAPVVDAPKPNQKKTGSTRGGRYYQRGGVKPAISTEASAPTEEKKPYRGDRADRGERGGGRGRGGRGRGRGGDREARPDRHSATGITDSHKKYHQGWGGDRGDTELKDETNGANDAANTSGDNAAPTGDAWGAPAATGDSWGAPAADAADPWAVPAGETPAENTETAEAKPAESGDKPRRKYVEEDEDDNKMTLDEYRAKNAESEVLPKLELRKAAEGTSEFFKNAVQLTKDVDANNYFVGKQTKAGGAPPKARKEGKQYIEIDARFDPPARGRGRGRGRGEGREGREGRGGGYRGDRNSRNQSQQQAVNMEDTNAFPAL